MPSFSQEIQTNNVLTKRILALRAKDGPNLENKMPETKQKSIEENLSLKYATKIMPQQSTDLLEMLEAKKQQLNTPTPALKEIADLIDLGSGSSHPIPSSTLLDLDFLLGAPEKLKFQEQHPADFATEQTV